jgi:hypothetical protein
MQSGPTKTDEAKGAIPNVRPHGQSVNYAGCARVLFSKKLEFPLVSIQFGSCDFQRLHIRC